jgi:hypothetical protein
LRKGTEKRREEKVRYGQRKGNKQEKKRQKLIEKQKKA